MRRTETVDCGEATHEEEDGEDEENVGEAVSVLETENLHWSRGWLARTYSA